MSSTVDDEEIEVIEVRISLANALVVLSSNAEDGEIQVRISFSLELIFRNCQLYAFTMKIPNFQTKDLIRAILVLGLATKLPGLLVDASDFGYTEENGELTYAICFQFLLDNSSEAATSPDTWPSKYPKYCAGDHQSPINIPTSRVAVVEFPPLSYDGFWGASKTATITNNGHSAEVSIKSELPIILNGGPLTEGYTFQQLHFHWGYE
uniref:(California timema) hypothetical protein n=1 Tax=Timema californicum TaxID=61474 RepID=A0A7R9J7U4_TIMCA|nr:unnamed protein product [Timema californicum]